jgi:tetratricopeptide (TPR) repeat protein
MTIEQLIDEERWVQARKEILRELRAKPDSHWLLTRLSLTYYEQRQYATSLKYVEKAKELMPACPLVLWDYAGTLQMLGRHAEAIDAYNAITSQGVKRLAHGDCGEGLAWARGLVADSYYRISQCPDALGDKEQAEAALIAHLDMRGPGCLSIYPLSKMGSKVTTLRNKRRRGLTSSSSRRPRLRRGRG